MIDQEEIHKHCLSDDLIERYEALNQLKDNFPQLPDKQQAWNDLHKLTNDQDIYVRRKAAPALGFMFSEVPDKQQAWNDLHRLTSDEDSYVRMEASFALGSAFSHVPDKQQAWNDLHRLTSDERSDVRMEVADVLGSIFPEVPDKQQAWNDLIQLTTNKYSSVRAYANHSLGKVSIFKASTAEKEEDYKQELEKAISFFEKAAQGPRWDNPSQFCLHFYRSFHIIIFKKQEAKEEVDKYLAEAKYAVGSSKSKELLFEAINNLANALKEVQNLENLDFGAKKDELSFYRKYCDHAAELMRNTDKKTPFATEVLRKGLPILDRHLKELLKEIQEKAKTVCKEAKGTDTEDIACEINGEVQKWEVSSQEEMTQRVEDLAYLLKMKVADLPENRYLLNKIEVMKNERDLAKQYDALLFVLGQIPTMKVVPAQKLDGKLLEFREDMKSEIIGAKKEIIGEIVSAKEEVTAEIVNTKDKLSCMSFNISNIGLNYSNVILMLSTVKADVENLNKISQLGINSDEVSNSNLAKQIDDLNKILQDRLDELEKSISYLPQNDKTMEILSKLNESKQSKLGDLVQTPASIVTFIGFMIQIIQLCQQYKLI
ncbi:hypothetical protein FXV91_09775 [Methanosarcina sp. DH2]|uniref:HEAT repeat domain-containing protein n=1 Tax=Methanosarcina sp. DH2 TaxID=2605639 RepID=UPI001E4FCE87|nr:HEAT repeat domain-containing protein [Methanosarcina sp. DH2]MCC4770462.1 hypothetical protein [Methanosarcina sp. DH2]